MVIINPRSEGKKLVKDQNGNPLALNNIATAAYELLGYLYDILYKIKRRFFCRNRKFSTRQNFRDTSKK